MRPVALDRQFTEWSEKSAPPAGDWPWFEKSGGSIGWSDLLARRRVVILAEAGSGKTTEMEEQARLQMQAGSLSFYATVEDVGRDGLESAVGVRGRDGLAEWRASGKPGWFFVDSVDEAKLNGIRLHKAVQRMAEGIAGAEARAHIVLSGRLTDWEFRRDLDHFESELPIPQDRPPQSVLTPDELLICIIRHERREEEAPPPPEKALVVIMASLGRERVKAFAIAKGVPDLDALLGEIDAHDLWSFARRPLDLGWLVEFWRTHGRLGPFAEMLQNSLTERLKEPNTDRARKDPLDAGRALSALERIGAALVLGRRTTITIPDNATDLRGGDSALDLSDVLSDWSPEDRGRLLTRAVFDPATFGRAHLHNDNLGVVRAYLAARWLVRLTRDNLPATTLRGLIFATTYGLRLVRPSIREAAAWLAIWDEGVAREIVQCDPSLLMTAGDPGSLRADLRRSVLVGVVDQLVSAAWQVPLLDADSVKRFSRADLSSTIQELWTRHSGHPGVRDFLLRLIWLGRLAACAGIALEAAFTDNPDPHSKLVAGRALVASCDADAKRRYAEFVTANCSTLPAMLIWDAVDGLFPDFIGVDALLHILKTVDVTDRGGGLGFQWQGEALVKRLGSWGDVERLLEGLLELVGEAGEEVIAGTPPDRRDAALFPALAAATHRLLDWSSPDEAPELAIDGAIRIGSRHRDHGGLGKQVDVGTDLRRAPARRRLAFWQAAAKLSGHRLLQGRQIESPWELNILGWSSGLLAEDLDWLLQDGPQRSADNERRLAINAAIGVCKEAPDASVLLARVEAVARTDAAMSAAYEAFLNPPSLSAAYIESERQIAEIRQRNAAAQASRDRDWRGFVSDIRENPGQLRQLRPPTEEGVDRRLYYLWYLLSDAVERRNRYAVDSVAGLEPILGREATEAFREALIGHWRAWRPRLKSAKLPDTRNQISSMDTMGVAGVTLEARANDRWAERLTSEQATSAAIYATVEINGLPWWLPGLARAKPDEVRRVFGSEIVAELDDPNPQVRCNLLEALTRSDDHVLRLMAPDVLNAVDKRPDLARVRLTSALEVISRGLDDQRPRFVQLARTRFGRLTEAGDAAEAAVYLGAVFAIDPREGTRALAEKLKALPAPSRKALAERVLPRIFGDSIHAKGVDPDVLPFDVLEPLVEIAFSAVRIEDDNRRPSGEAYSPDERDHAEHARGAAFQRLAQTPCRAAFDAILRFAQHPDFPIPADRLRAMARDRAAEDSESAAWPPAEALAFERSHDTAPRTGRDLQRVALGRLSDMQHMLLHGDFTQGTTLSALPDEAAVQNWIADRLRQQQGRAFSIEREPHVAGEREPDMRFRAKASDASVAMEVKVAGSWTTKDLEAALRDQLCGRYLRARDARHGILLLVLQKPRPKGWRDPATGAYRTFVQLVGYLEVIAAEIAGSASDAPQPEIASIDVSSCTAEETPD